MTLGPFDWTARPFLALYGGLLAAMVLAGILIPHWMRPEGRARAADPDALAYLAGGATRYVDALVARLLASGALAMDGRAAFRVVRRDARATAPEAAVLALPSPAKWGSVQQAATLAAPTVEQRLLRDGLLFGRNAAWQVRLLQTAPYLLLIVLGAIKWEIGTMRGRPVEYLTALLVVTALFALIRFAIVDRRTRGGVAALRDARAASQRLRRAPAADETGLAVALFGTAVLSGSPWGDYHAMRAASGGGDSGSDGGGGCGGGGGGGGCGGCSS